MPLDKEKVKKVVTDVAALTKKIEDEAKSAEKDNASLKDLVKTLDEIEDED